MATNFHFVPENIKKGSLEVQHISTNDQLVDGFTKPFPSSRFLLIRDKLGVHNVTLV